MMASPNGETKRPTVQPTSPDTPRRESLPTNMEEGAEFMKEEDAAILERGLGDSCSSGETPILVSTANGEQDFPVMMLNESMQVINEEGNVSPSRSRGNSHHSMGNESFRQIMHIEEAHAILEHVASMDPSKEKNEIAKVVFRRCLSGDIRQSLQESLEDDTTSSPLSVTDDLRHLLVTELQASSSTLPETVPLKSSRSIDRMMNEAVQFAEAVGELPPSDKSEIRQIIDDEGSEFDDESGDEVDLEAIGEDRSFKMESLDESLVRSDSVERKLIEAAQYAEAVGEMPPSSEAELREIIEDGGSDEESAQEVCVDEALKSLPSSPLPCIRPETVFVEENGADVANEKSVEAEPVQFRRKSRPQWPLKQQFETSSILHKLPDGLNTQDFVYKGICSNPPEITKHGIQRGNYAQLHRKAWLEVSDKYHRYGKHLRLYYRYWEQLGFPHNSFFDWLDSKGEAAGEPLPNLDECPRSQLDSDTVLYITNPDVTDGYALNVIPDESGRGLVVDVDCDPVKTGSEGWIFVLRDNVLYGAQKIASISGHSKQRFHHSSFFGGKAVAAAGILITDDDGYLTLLYPHSGHYRPGEAHMQRMLFYLHHKGVSLRTFELDTQQILHVNRNDTTAADVGAEGQEKKKKKVDSLHLMPAIYVASFLAHKARFIDAGIFAQIHKIRKADVTSVTEALDEVDDGGFWKGVDKDAPVTTASQS